MPRPLIRLIVLIAACAFPAAGGTVVANSQAVTSAAEDVLRAVFTFIDPRPDDHVVAGADLDGTHKEDLRAALNRPLSPMLSSPGYLIAANVIVVERVEVTGDRATVRVVDGPVPHDPRIECGRRITIPLRRTTTWRVDEDEVWAQCAFAGKRSGSKEEEELRDVFGWR